MAGFFSKLFGGKNKTQETNNPQAIVEEALNGIIEKAGFNLSFDIEVNGNGEQKELKINLYGEDEEILKDRKAQVLDAIQLFLKRVAQHNFPDDKTAIHLDSGGFREESQQALIERAENLKAIVLEQGKSVYYRALPPRERKIVHQYLAQDPRVKSRSLGDGLYKKIKIYPAKNNTSAENTSQ